MMTTCATRLRDKWFSHARRVSSAPQCSMVRKKKIAPQTIRMGVKATSNPAITEAWTCVKSAPNQTSCKPYVTAAASGNALAEGIGVFFVIKKMSKKIGPAAKRMLACALMLE